MSMQVIVASALQVVYVVLVNKTSPSDRRARSARGRARIPSDERARARKRDFILLFDDCLLCFSSLYRLKTVVDVLTWADTMADHGLTTRRGGDQDLRQCCCVFRAREARGYQYRWYRSHRFRILHTTRSLSVKTAVRSHTTYVDITHTHTVNRGQGSV
jgi:hypothetical protein